MAASQATIALLSAQGESNDDAMISRMIAIIGAVALSNMASARDTLGVYESWGAFRDPAPLRCYAIALPAEGAARANGRAYASIGRWPGKHGMAQLYIRLSRSVAQGALITLSIGSRRFRLTGTAQNAWAQDAEADRTIIAAMRNGTSMSVEAKDMAGQPFADAYALRGAASAIDSAALGCIQPPS